MPLTLPLKAAAFYVALHVLLIVVLALRVVRYRRSQKVGMGDGGSKELARLIRVHGNAVEQAAPNMAILILLGLLAAPVQYVHIFGLVSIIGRVLHAAGLSKTGGSSLGRVLGMVLTLTALIAGAVGLLYLALL